MLLFYHLLIKFVCVTCLTLEEINNKPNLHLRAALALVKNSFSEKMEGVWKRWNFL